MGCGRSSMYSPDVEVQVNAALATAPSKSSGVKRALVLAGGGSYGAYECGALQVLCDPKYKIPGALIQTVFPCI